MLVRLDLLSLLGFCYRGLVLFLYLVNPFNMGLGVLSGCTDMIQDLDRVLKPVLVDTHLWLVT